MFVYDKCNRQIKTIMDVAKTHYREIPNVIDEVRALCDGKTVRTITPASRSCAESYPCRGHSPAVILFESGETVRYECSSVHMGAIMYYYGIANKHFTKYLNDDCKSDIDKMRSQSDLEESSESDQDDLTGWYSDVTDKIMELISLCEGKTILTITEIDGTCLESYPCQGHEGAKILFTSGETLEYPCSSVTLGCIMYYFKIANMHFAEYVNKGQKQKLDALRGSLSK